MAGELNHRETGKRGASAQLAHFAVAASWDSISPEVRHQTKRALINFFATALAGCKDPALLAATQVFNQFRSSQDCTVIGHAQQTDMLHAASLNAMSGNVFDFDDTHLKTIIHPAGPVAPAVLALGQHLNISGRELIDAMVIGIEVSCRVGNAMYPDHYDRGWHITGSTGTLGAAAACARMLGLDAQQTAMALGIAASQPIGMREQFGTMTKPFHPGAAARAGLMSALLASKGFTASSKALEAPRGMMQTISTKNDWTEITSELGERFEISFNSYKPFACGIVIHPSIDACAQLRAQGVTPDQVQSIELKVHSLVLELTGKKEPADGLQAKFSVYHGCAAGLFFGHAAEDEFSDEVVNRPDMVALRRKVVATVDDSIDEASADVTALLHDGRRVHVFVEHAIGSLQNPMTDALLEGKFHGLSDSVLGAARTAEVIQACWKIGQAADLRGLTALLRP